MFAKIDKKINLIPYNYEQNPAIRSHSTRYHFRQPETDLHRKLRQQKFLRKKISLKTDRTTYVNNSLAVLGCRKRQRFRKIS